MWIVAKVKNNHEIIFTNELSKKLKKNFVFYYPKVCIQENKKEKSKNILGNYVFCYDNKLDPKMYNSQFSFLKGLQYFMFGNSNDSKQIDNFVKFCKKSEDKQGYISNSFFFNIIKTKAKIISGPLKNIILNIINIDRNKIVANAGRIKVSINKKSGNCCYPV